MKTTVTRTQPKLSSLTTIEAILGHPIPAPAKSRSGLYRSIPYKFFINRVMNSRFAFALVVFFCASALALAQDDWQNVDERKALLEFKDATRTRLMQRMDGETTFEQSYWTLDDGASVYFHVTWLGKRWALTDEGLTPLEEVFNRSFPDAELGEVGERFVNKEGGTQGDAQWLRYRRQGTHCVLMRQYGWDDDSQITSAAEPLGNRVAIGTHCSISRLSSSEIEQLFKRIDF